MPRPGNAKEEIKEQGKQIEELQKKLEGAEQSFYKKSWMRKNMKANNGPVYLKICLKP